MPTEQWGDNANVAIAEIRATGAGAMLSITDPMDRFAFGLHQYFDSDFSGNSPTCVAQRPGSCRNRTSETRFLRRAQISSEVSLGITLLRIL